MTGPRHAVSVKGVCIQDGRVLLLRNERDEWELPGGRLEPGEEPADCVTREVREESGWPVRPVAPLDTWQYRIFDGVDVLIITFGCTVGGTAAPVVSSEHRAAALFDRAAVPGLTMPDGYKRSILDWYARLDRAG